MESFGTAHSCGTAQLEWHAIYDRVGMMLTTFSQLMTNLFDRKMQRSATAIVPRTSEKLSIRE